MKAFIALVLVSAVCVLGTPLSYEPIAPSFDAYRDVRLLLQTRQNRGSPFQLSFRDLTSINTSFFNRDRPTRFLIHGWTEDDSADISTETSRELLDYYDFNVIFVDWSAGSQTINYIAARNRVPTVGQFVASYLDFLNENGLVNFDRVSVIGFSLGAHIAGMVGKNARSGRINTIIGLDPAGPLFSVGNPSERLDAGDANYVEAIHTNGGLLGAGIGAPIAHADFFPNGGTSQSGCITAICHHNRAVAFYVESIIDNRFWAMRCANANDAGRERCTLTPGAWMGGEPSNAAVGLRGIFHLSTNRFRPFGQGQ